MTTIRCVGCSSLYPSEMVKFHCPVCSTDFRAQLETVTRERDEAIAHDRQPYPTAEAYEKVCASHAASRARITQLRADVAAMRSALDWASKEAKGRLPDWWHALALAPNPGAKLLEAARKALAALATQNYRLGETRKRCGCLSMAGHCPQCTTTAKVEEMGSAALEALADAGVE